jgi:hypothetical protein
MKKRIFLVACSHNSLGDSNQKIFHNWLAGALKLHFPIVIVRAPDHREKVASALQANSFETNLRRIYKIERINTDSLKVYLKFILSQMDATGGLKDFECKSFELTNHLSFRNFMLQSKMQNEQNLWCYDQ